jgi:hypothetical protein
MLRLVVAEAHLPVWAGVCSSALVPQWTLDWRYHMAQTIWIHKLADAKKAEADGMDYICQHISQGLAQTGKLTTAKGWNPLPDAGSKDGATYRALLCDSCAKNYNNTNVRTTKEPVLA